MKITYGDFLEITDSIRNKLYEYSFPPIERDIIMNALGLYGARIPGKLDNGMTSQNAMSSLPPFPGGGSSNGGNANGNRR